MFAADNEYWLERFPEKVDSFSWLEIFHVCIFTIFVRFSFDFSHMNPTLRSFRKISWIIFESEREVKAFAVILY